MFKKSIAIALALVVMGLSLLTVGCSLVEVDTERDLDTVVCVVCGEKITKRMVLNEWNRMKVEQGVNDEYETSPSNESIFKTVLENVLEDMSYTVVIREHARSLGLYPLTDENLQKMYDLADQTYEDRVAAYEQSLVSTYASMMFNDEMTEFDLSEKARQEVDQLMLDNFEFSREMDLRAAEAEVIKSLIEDHYSEGMTVTDNEVREYYDTELATQKEDFSADTTLFGQYLTDETYADAVILYHPGNVVRVKQIRISIPEDAYGEVSLLRADGDDAGADAKLKEALAGIEATAKEALKKAENGDDFDQLIVEYGDDTNMATQAGRDSGIIIARESTSYTEELQSAALAMTKEGEISGLVADDYGYHILYATNVYAEKEIPFDDVKDAIADKLLREKKSDAYATALLDVINNCDAKYYNNRLTRGNINTVGMDKTLLIEEKRFDVE